MSALHDCPYCRTVYRYKDLIFMKGKVHECYHCKKKFKISREFPFLLILVLSIILIAANTITIKNTQDLSINSFFTMAVIDASCLMLSFLFCPLLLRFKKTKK